MLDLLLFAAFAAGPDVHLFASIAPQPKGASSQQVMRWSRCYKASEGIHYFYDIDTLADPP
jgi:hypothetical protein